MDSRNNYNLADMEFQYALGLVGLFSNGHSFIHRHSLWPGGTHPEAAPDNQRIRGQTGANGTTRFSRPSKKTQESVILNLHGALFPLGKVDNLQIQLLQADIFLSPHMFIGIAILLAALAF